MQFSAKIEAAEEGGFIVTCRDIPEAITQGDDEADALLMAEDALITALDFYFEDNRVVPWPSPAQEGDRMIPLPRDCKAKVLLHNEVIERTGTLPDAYGKAITGQT